jgi:hypothetical protein
MVVGAGTAPEALYVGLTRGRHANHVHVITRPGDEAQPVGAVHTTPRVDPLAVLTSIVRPDDNIRDTADAAAVEQADTDQVRRESVQTAVERFAAEAEMVYAARTAATLDRLTADGTLTADQRRAFPADPSAMGSLARLLRTAELAGHDPDYVLTEAVTSRDLTGARSLPQVVYGRIEQQLAGRLAPTATSYADMVPAVASARWRMQLTARARDADDRRNQLGTETAADRPQWALGALGPVPDEPVARLEWEHQAGTVAAWRELIGRIDAADPLGPAPSQGLPEHYATWQAAWTALGRPEATRADAELSDGQLRVRVRAMAREEAWAPTYVGESLTATSLAAQTRRRDAELIAARADAAADPAETDRLRQQAADAAAIADALDLQVRQLERADQARARWLLHTAVTRDAAERARAELAARGVPLDSDADGAVTAEEWLAAHRAEQADADKHRPITDEHDLAEVADQRTVDIASGVDVEASTATAETAMPDIREAPAEPVVDAPGHIPQAAESEAAVKRAQAALAEIEHRRTMDQQRAAEERRVSQLNHWAADDARSSAADAVNEATDTMG